MDKIRTIIELLLALSKVMPLDKLMALFKAALPLPANDAQVPAYLTGLGIGDPLHAVLVPLVQLLTADQAVFGAVVDYTKAEYETALTAEVCYAAGDSKIDPATIAAIVQLVMTLIEIWKNRRQPQGNGDTLKPL